MLRLRKLGIAHVSRAATGHINTPIEILGPVAGVSYRPLWRGRLICDCRLALALVRAGPFFRALGVRTAYFSSAYRRASARSRAPSRHALGLAIDVHRIKTSSGRVLRLKKDFERGLDDACERNDRPTLNRLACLLKRHRVFDRVLTPDTNRDHYNHYHLAILDFQRRRAPRFRRPHPVIRE